MPDQRLRIPRIQRIKAGIMNAVPVRLRPVLRDQVQRRRLAKGIDPLGQPADHERFLREHLVRLGTGPRDRLRYLEFGVYQGASLAAAGASVRRRRSGVPDLVRRVRLLRRPPAGQRGRGLGGEGWFVTSRRTTDWNLRRLGVADRCELVEGWVRGHLHAGPGRRASDGPMSS